MDYLIGFIFGVVTTTIVIEIAKVLLRILLQS